MKSLKQARQRLPESLILGLVRRMLPIARVAFIGYAVLSLASCVHNPIVRGGHRWTYDDTLEIDRLVSQRPDIPKPVETVEMVAPDQAVVYCGRIQPFAPGPHYQTVFTIYRRNGGWIIDESSIRKQEFVITG